MYEFPGKVYITPVERDGNVKCRQSKTSLQIQTRILQHAPGFKLNKPEDELNKVLNEQRKEYKTQVIPNLIFHSVFRRLREKRVSLHGDMVLG